MGLQTYAKAAAAFSYLCLILCPLYSYRNFARELIFRSDNKGITARQDALL